MKNLYIYFALLGFCWLNLNAQHEAKAASVMNSSRQKFNGFKDVSANFKYTLENKNLKNGNITKSGSIKMKGKKYRISFSEQEVICDGINIWVIMKPEKEVSISDFDPDESLSIDRLYKIFENETKARYDKEETISGVIFHKVSMFSINKNSDFTRVEVWINKKTEIIERAVIAQRNGAFIKYELSNLKTDAGIQDTDFVFNKASYAGYEIIDLR